MDIYILAPVRTAAEVERFLACFLPDRVRAEADYVVTLDGTHPIAEFDNPDELARYCEAHPETEGRAYWTSRSEGDPHSAHVFFLPAGGLVFGLSVVSKEQAAWERWLTELRAFAGATHGYWTAECAPPDTVAEFVAAAQWHAARGSSGEANT
jgi:hypothetical protein